ncbi:MAG: PD40 domain-containing protein [Calditrichaeota bacterium]|nr:PD40 domain-containing protein [Calditrichota bacterium]
MRNAFARQPVWVLMCLILLSGSSTVLSQWFYFGRNKVQYTDFKWKILKTDHFDIYYYPEMETLAERGAYFAEEAFLDLENKFNFQITRRIPLIFYSSHLHFQQTNITPGFIPEGVGGFFEFLKGRVVIPSNGSINAFRKVIRHELVHVFMHAKVYFANKEHGRFDGTYPPLWFVEGIAEHWSSEWDAQAEMVIRDAVLHNYIVPLSSIFAINGTYTMYKEGQAILKYISETYGDEKLLLMLENIWKYNRFEGVFQEVLGLDYKQFDEEWLYHLKKKYYPMLGDHDFSRMVTNTIVRKGFNFQPAYYKDPEKGEQVIFVGNRSGFLNIYQTPYQKLNPASREELKILVKGGRSSDFETFHIFSNKMDVSKDGWMAFSSKSGENDALYIYDIPSGDIIRKFTWPDMVGITNPAFSPDGNRIVFSGLRFNGHNDLFVLDLADEKITQLTNDFYDDRAPSFSPDGKKLVFSSDRTTYGGNWCYNLFIYDLETHLTYYLTAGNYQDDAPAWSPDGKHIAFTSDRDSTLNIWIADLTGIADWQNGSYLDVELRQITRFANAAFHPEWMDDQRMLFAVFEGSSFQIRSIEDVPGAIDSASVVAQSAPIHANRHWHPGRVPGNKVVAKLDYKKKYNLDVAQTQVNQDPFWGTNGGALFAFTDMLGNDQYYFLLYNSAQRRDDFFKATNFAVSKISLGKRTNYAYGLFRFAGLNYNFKESYFYEDRVGSFFTLSYPFSTFKRFEFNTSLSYSDKEISGAERRFAVLSANSLSFIHDNSIWGYTGPIEGHRYNFSIANTYDFRFSNVNYWTFLADYRHYFRINPKLTYAVRFLGLLNDGRETRYYVLGGSWDLRLYDRWSVRGEKIAFTSHELRFPFIDYLGIKFPFMSMVFPGIRGALFVDAGNAWNGSDYDGLLGSMGFGTRLNLGGFLVLRWDMGRRTDFKSIENTWYTQFFFGWDF